MGSKKKKDEKIIKFILNPEIIEFQRTYDIEYTAIIGKKTTKIIWQEDGEFLDTFYDTKEVNTYFSDSTWLKI